MKTFGLSLLGHAILSGLVWLQVDDSAPGWANDAFELWLALAVGLALAIVAASIMAGRGAWSAAAGAGLALVVECSMFVLWVGTHSA